MKHLCACTTLHRWFSFGKIDGPITKPAGSNSRINTDDVLQGQELVY